MQRLQAAAGTPVDRPRIVAVDGRGGAGKRTLVDLLQAQVPRSAVVHTDDVAWHHSSIEGRRCSRRPPRLDAAGRRGPPWKALPKVVFSTTLSTVQGNALLASGGLAEEIERSASRAGGGRRRRHRAAPRQDAPPAADWQP